MTSHRPLECKGRYRQHNRRKDYQEDKIAFYRDYIRAFKYQGLKRVNRIGLGIHLRKRLEPIGKTLNGIDRSAREKEYHV